MKRLNNMQTINEQASIWISKEQDGLNEQENKLFLKWLENSTHQEAYDSIIDIRNAFKTLPSFCQNQLKFEVKKELRMTKVLQKLKPLAFVAVFLLTVSFTIFQMTSSSNPLYSEEFVSEYKLNTVINLQDGSKIILDANSKIKVDFFKNTRKVAFLKGKAIFEVKKDISRPFIIYSNNVQIEVVGTKFEVTNIKNISTIQVKEGTVKVSQQIYANKYKILSLLTKGQNVSINTKGEILSYGEIEPSEIATWQKGYIVFNKTSLKDALDEFSRYVDINVAYEDFELSKLPIAGKFSINEFDKFLSALPKIYPIKIKDLNKTITISNKIN
ncbi:MAG: hypothetical protein COA66_08070 [Arcobacter sp.]|nr:MAG: hypothetical protein COA66_08070 [Arcobacter sp.]